MARYKEYNYDQLKFIPLSFSRQIVPGSFEYTLNYVIDHEIDLGMFASRYKNDETGAPAYDPAILLKIILYAYSRGITSSRQIERCCRENVIFMALSADTQPHFTTIADFISTMSDEIIPLFLNVLLICDELGLIGKDMFAIDGCKLPSNASKEWSGTKADLAKKREKMTKAIRYVLHKHREEDTRGDSIPHREKETQQVATLRRQIKKIKDWLKANDDKPGKTGKPRKSNLTDNDGAKMKTSHGVLQGYDGVASVDAKYQIVVHAQAFGEAQEHDLLQPMIEETRANFQSIGKEQDIFKRASLTADSGFHSEANMQALFAQKIDGYVADRFFRQRDPRFATAERYRARTRAERQQRTTSCYRPRDFHYDPLNQTCICPAGHSLYRNGSHSHLKGRIGIKFQGAKRDCLPCTHRKKCLWHPERTPTRQVMFFDNTQSKSNITYTDRMKIKIDSPEGRHQYSRRLGIVEPVFANICSTLGLKRFSFRGNTKVNIQWKLFCIVHNLFKVHRYGLVG